MSDPILIVLHQEHSTPGRVGRLLRERGFALDIRRPRFGDPLPSSMSGHVGAIVFGGPMSANDSEPWIRREIDWIEVPLREQAPFLGICLGAQMLARQLGGRVGRHDRGHHEIGYYPLHPTAAGRSLFEWPSHVYHWHGEGFETVAGTELLARGDMFENQAFRFGPSAYGLQFHPEVTHAMMCRWTVHGHNRLDEPGAQDRHTQLSGRYQYDHQVRAWLDTFLETWLSAPLSLSVAAEQDDVRRRLKTGLLA